MERVSPSDIEIRERLEPERIQQLMDLYASEWWTAAREPDDVAAMVDASDFVVVLIHRPTDRLLGFGRVLTDFVYIAVILDVIVAREARGTGLGTILMNAIVNHPRLASVQSLELVCQPELVPFYGRWGFTEKVGRSRLMRRSSDPLLVSA